MAETFQTLTVLCIFLYCHITDSILSSQCLQLKGSYYRCVVVMLAALLKDTELENGPSACKCHSAALQLQAPEPVDFYIGAKSEQSKHTNSNSLIFSIYGAWYSALQLARVFKDAPR